MARGAHVGVDPPVSSVGAPAHFGSLVHLDVFNHQRIHIETLELSIALCIFEHVQQELRALLGPASLCPAPLLGLGTSTNSSVVATEGNTLLLQGHILQVLGGLADVHALDGLGSLTMILKLMRLKALLQVGRM